MSLDRTQIQGDILSGFPKKAETFYFFEFDDGFLESLSRVIPYITSFEQVLAERQRIKHSSQIVPVRFVNIAFSAKGLKKVCFNLVYGSFY
jgi:hypothetical protein